MKTGPYTLCHTDRGSPPWWALLLAFVGLACTAVAAVRPNADGQTIVFSGMLFGGLASVVWACVEQALEIWRETR
jgi:hypothetical protein